MAKPCKSHIAALEKVSTKLRWGLTMDGSTLILSSGNQNKLEEAERALRETITILTSIE
jgi:hypothetical protein